MLQCYNKGPLHQYWVHVNSRGLGEGGGKIHRNYNRWVNNLDKDIQKELRKTSALR